jgi:hypothetical protein
MTRTCWFGLDEVRGEGKESCWVVLCSVCLLLLLLCGRGSVVCMVAQKSACDGDGEVMAVFVMNEVGSERVN